MRFVALLFSLAAALMGGLVILLNAVDAGAGVAVVTVCALTVAVGVFSAYHHRRFPEVRWRTGSRKRRAAPLVGARHTRH